MAKINILFTPATLKEMFYRKAPVPEGFDGPRFTNASLTLEGSFVVISTYDDEGQESAVYMYPATAISRIKISE